MVGAQGQSALRSSMSRDEGVDTDGGRADEIATLLGSSRIAQIPPSVGAIWGPTGI